MRVSLSQGGSLESPKCSFIAANILRRSGILADGRDRRGGGFLCWIVGFYAGRANISQGTEFEVTRNLLCDRSQYLVQFFTSGGVYDSEAVASWGPVQIADFNPFQ